MHINLEYSVRKDFIPLCSTALNSTFLREGSQFFVTIGFLNETLAILFIFSTLQYIPIIKYQFINIYHILLSNDFVLAFDSRIIATLSSGNFHIKVNLRPILFVKFFATHGKWYIVHSLTYSGLKMTKSAVLSYSLLPKLD